MNYPFLLIWKISDFLIVCVGDFVALKVELFFVESRRVDSNNFGFIGLLKGWFFSRVDSKIVVFECLKHLV